MGLKYYLNLFKKESTVEAVRLRYYLGVFIFLAALIFVAAFTSLLGTNSAASSFFGALALITLIVCRVLNKKFKKFINQLVSEEPADESNELDAAISAYRKGYAAAEEEKSLPEKILLLVDIIFAAMYFALFATTVALGFAENTAVAEKIFSIMSIAVFVYLGLGFLVGMFMARNGVWYQQYHEEIAVINKYKATTSDNGVKYKILEDKKPVLQFLYLLPAADLYKKYRKLLRLQQTSGWILGGIFGLSLVGVPVIIGAFSGNEGIAGMIAVLLVAGSIFLFTVESVIISVMQSRIVKKQYLILKESESENNSLHIRLHELRTPFYKRWNMFFLFGFIGAVISNVVFAGVSAAIMKNDGYGLLFFLLFVIEIIALFVFFFKDFGKLRFKMMKIEDEIDKNKTAE